MTDITIPPEAVEAAAIDVAALLDWYDWGPMEEPDKVLCRRIATAALRAGIAAWPGMLLKLDGRYALLPLPQEVSDD